MPEPNWDDLRVFLALAREGTLTGAARHLGSGIATIARRIDRFEATIGVPLFLRHQSGYRLTDQGKALLPRAEVAEQAMSGLRLAAEAQRDIRGHVRIASIETLIAPVFLPALAALLEANPGLDVEIRFEPQTVNLHRHDADIAVRFSRPEHGNLKVRQLAVMGFGLYGPPDGSRPERRLQWPGEIELSPLQAWTRALGEPDAPRLSINSLVAHLAAVRQGLGAGLLPHFLARPAGLTLLADRLPDGSPMERPILLVIHADVANSRRVRAVAAAIAAEIGRRSAELSG